MFCETLALGVQDKHWNMDGELIAVIPPALAQHPSSCDSD